jgi:hypothetical protein
LQLCRYTHPPTHTPSAEGGYHHIKEPGDIIYLVQEFQLLKIDSGPYIYSSSELANASGSFVMCVKLGIFVPFLTQSKNQY